MNKKAILKKICALLLCFTITGSVTLAGAAAANCPEGSEEQSNTITREDGSYLITRSLLDGTKVINDYTAESELDAASTIRTENGVRTGVTDFGDEVFKTVYDTNTGATQIYTKASGAPDSEFILYFEMTPDALAGKKSDYMTPEPRSYVVETYKANCFDYRMHTFSNNGHDLWMGGSLASAAPNKFLDNCKSFKSYAQDCDSNTYDLIGDIFGFVPGVDILLSVGEVLYEGAIKKDTSAAVGKALYNYAIAVAEVVCKPAQAISVFIDGVSLLSNLRYVRQNWETVYNGMS